jgi:hypothetical protein
MAQTGSLAALLPQQYLGRLAVFDGLRESGDAPSLNHKKLRVVRVDHERDRLVVDATPAASPPHVVRHVSVPRSKLLFLLDDLSDTCLQGAVWTFASINSKNIAGAFEKSGLDLASLHHVAVRSHPDIEPTHVWRDLSRLCTKLNAEGAPGAPFAPCYGYSVFGDVTDENYCKSGEQYRGPRTTANPIPCLTGLNASFNVEPHLVMRNREGALIDVAPDVWSHHHHIPVPYKLFVPEPAFSNAEVGAMGDQVCMWASVGALSAEPWTERVASAFTGDRAVEDLGMAPECVLKPPRIEGPIYNIYVHPLLDSTLAPRGNEELHAKTIGLRREQVRDQGTLLVSRTLARRIITKHCQSTYSMVSFDSGDTGVLCFGCYARIAEEEARVCDGCRKARYCSAACQHWHWRNGHKACCASKEDRARRRAAAQEAAAQRSANQRKHDAREAAAKEAERKAARAATRAATDQERADRAAERQRLAAPGPSHRAGKANRSAKRNAPKSLAHELWARPDEKALRADAFDAAQAAAHLAAEAKKARARADAAKALENELLKEIEAKTHEVPVAASIGAVLGAALRQQ